MRQKWLAMLSIILLGEALMSAPQKADISIEAGEVPVDVLVTEDGKPIATLTADDFEIFDSGVRQEILSARLQKDTPVDVILVFDMSGSVKGDLLDRLKNAADGLLRNLKSEDYATFIAFNNAVILGSPPTRDFESIKQVINRTQPLGNSSLIDASYAGLVLAQRKRNPPLLIIFSDGCDTSSWLTSEAVLKVARVNNAVVYAVSINRKPKNVFLMDLAKLTGGGYFEVESRDLPSRFLHILEEFRQRYVVFFMPSGVSEGGWHNLDVRVKRRSAKITARSCYTRNSASK